MRCCAPCAVPTPSRNGQARTVERYGAEFKLQDPGKLFLSGSRTEENLISQRRQPHERLLRIFSPRTRQDQDALNLSTATIECQPEYASLYEINAANERAALPTAAQDMITDSLLLPAERHAQDQADHDDSRAMEVLRRATKSNMAAAANIDQTTQHPLHPGRESALRYMYVR